jgi:hypothetical protein
MKKLLQKLRRRSQTDGKKYTTLDSGQESNQKWNSSIEPDVSSNSVTKPAKLSGISSINYEDTVKSHALADSRTKQNTKVEERSVYGEAEQQGIEKVLETRTISSSINDAETSQHASSSAIVPENVSPFTETTQPIISRELSRLVESVAYSRNTNELIDTIQVQFTPPCSTCYALDARKIPTGTKHDDWAQIEYNVSAEMPSRKLSLGHAQLLDSSALGCIYCVMICKSLSDMRPGWETQSSFIELFLAPNLPIVVRWIRGSTSTMGPLWEESLGANIQWSIELKTATTPGNIEPDIEFEIYRPEVLDQMSISGTSLPWPVILMN